MYDDVILFFRSEGFEYNKIHNHFHVFSKIISGIHIKIVCIKLIVAKSTLGFRVEANLKSYGIYSYEGIKTNLNSIISKIVIANEKYNPSGETAQA